MAQTLKSTWKTLLRLGYFYWIEKKKPCMRTEETSPLCVFFLEESMFHVHTVCNWQQATVPLVCGATYDLKLTSRSGMQL